MLIKKERRKYLLSSGLNLNFMKRLFLFLAFFSLFSCSQAPLQAKRSEAFERPSCSGGPTAGELERQKDDLFRKIESSGNYTNTQARDSALQGYRRIIAGEEEFSCPRDVELLIQGIAELHET